VRDAAPFNDLIPVLAVILNTLVCLPIVKGAYERAQSTQRALDL